MSIAALAGGTRSDDRASPGSQACPVTGRPICDYEGSDYQEAFWDQGGREYEDQAESIALKRLLPHGGVRLLDVGAGAGRNAPRYSGFQQVVLVDYSTTQLQQAIDRLGRSGRYAYVAADAYRLPFREGVFDAATMIRTLHHMVEPLKALEEVRATLGPDAVFILEFANKQNLKAIVRYVGGRQTWSPFSAEAVEFAKLNFNFHPSAVRKWLRGIGFQIERTLTVSHFRLGALKRAIGPRLLAKLDGLLQPTGRWFQYTPSVFVRARVPGSRPFTANGQAAGTTTTNVEELFRCPKCRHAPLEQLGGGLHCTGCGSDWAVQNGIYDFRVPE